MTALRAKPFAGSAASTGPDKPGLRADEFVTTNGNRWSAPGEPTIYLGSDPGVAIAEQGRHWAERGSTVALWTVEVRLQAVVDLRDAETRTVLWIPEEPTWVLDRDRCLELARTVRRQGGFDGLLAPSAAFLDDPSRHNIVVFVDRLAPSLESTISVVGASHALRVPTER
ncbi:MAG TPA: RES family NAD+ phosphorylase [Candidatus Saccharimonadales bacterium]|nr:RES family NAD+ phosphorylase [Candidatus Saccharimonadales bacterium]